MNLMQQDGHHAYLQILLLRVIITLSNSNNFDSTHLIIHQSTTISAFLLRQSFWITTLPILVQILYGGYILVRTTHLFEVLFLDPTKIRMHIDIFFISSHVTKKTSNRIKVDKHG